MDFHKIKKLMKEKFKEDPDFVYGFPTLAMSYDIERHKWWTKNFSRIQSEGFGDFLCFLVVAHELPETYSHLYSTAKKLQVEDNWQKHVPIGSLKKILPNDVAEKFIKKNSKKIVEYTYGDDSIGYFYVKAGHRPRHSTWGHRTELSGILKTQTKTGEQYLIMPNDEYQNFIKQIQSLFREMRTLDEKSRNERKGVETTNRLKSLVNFGTEQEILRDYLEQVQNLIPRAIEILSLGEANKKDLEELSRVMNCGIATISTLSRNKTFYGSDQADTKRRIDDGIIKRPRKSSAQTPAKPGRKK